MDVTVQGMEKAKPVLEKLFYGYSGFNSESGFLDALEKCTTGEIDKIESKPIKVINRKFKIIFEHCDPKHHYPSLACVLKLYLDEGEGYNRCIHVDSKANYVNKNWRGELVIETRLGQFFRKCLTIIFEHEHKAYRTIIDLDHFCDWTMEYLFEKNDLDLAGFLQQKVQDMNVAAFNYCLEHSPNIVPFM